MARGWTHRRGSPPPPQATEVCRQCGVPFQGDLEAAAHRQTRKRAKITAEVIAKVKALVVKNKTGNEIAKEVGISLPSVGNIKKKLGLVRAKK